MPTIGLLSGWRPRAPDRGPSHPDDRLVEWLAAARTEEGRIAEAEDPAVGGHEPVAESVQRLRHTDDRLVESRQRPEGLGRTERVDRSRGGHDPVRIRRPEAIDQSGQNRYHLIRGCDVSGRSARRWEEDGARVGP